MTSELAPYVPPGQSEIEYTWNLAAKLSKTEFVPNNLRGKPEAVLAVFLTGRELGIGPMQSLRDIYPVNGRPALMASLMVARVRGLGHRFRTIRSTDELATVQIHRKGEPEPEPPIEFTLADAERAELDRKAVWRQYPKAMLWNRAASAACRRDCPEALGGATYTPEEIEDGNGATTATWGAPEPQTSGAGEAGHSPASSGDTAERPAPDPTSSPSASPGKAGGGGTTSGADGPPTGTPEAEAQPGQLRPGAGSRTAPDHTSAAAGSVAAADPPEPSEDGDAIPPAPDDGAGLEEHWGVPPTANPAVPSVLPGPTPPSDPSPVLAWCEFYGVDIRIARTYLRRSHAREFPDLRDRKDLEELRPPRSDLAIEKLTEWRNAEKGDG